MTEASDSDSISTNICEGVEDIHKPTAFLIKEASVIRGPVVFLVDDAKPQDKETSHHTGIITDMDSSIQSISLPKTRNIPSVNDLFRKETAYSDKTAKFTFASDDEDYSPPQESPE